MSMLFCPILAAEGGEQVDYVLNFFTSVGAGVATYFICKWLDRHDNR